MTLVFDAAGAGGSAGCNTYGGPFQYENNTLTFGALVTTLIACEPDIMTQETAYLDALRTATTPPEPRPVADVNVRAMLD